MSRFEDIKYGVMIDNQGFYPFAHLSKADFDWLIKAVEELKEFASDINKNWDCDSDAHRYDTTCRACEAGKILEKLFEE